MKLSSEGVVVTGVTHERESWFADVELLTATHVVRTACHARRVYVDEKELAHGDRSLAIVCPGCGAGWVVCIAGPVATWRR